MIITVDHVTKTFGERVLFKDAFLRVGGRDRVALVGPNGAGKTTLLEIMVGEQDCDEGSVITPKDVVIGYLKQEAIEMAGSTVLAEVLKVAGHVTSLEHRMHVLEEDIAEAEQGPALDALLTEYGRLQERFEHLGGYTLESDARAVLTGLGFKEHDLTRDTSEFSGGWLMRIAMAKLLLQQPDVLLLDEPTNHLDLEAIDALVEALAGFDGTLLLVSHDRWFVSRLATRIVEITEEGLNDFPGTYDEYLESCGDDHLDAESVELKVRRERRRDRVEREARAKQDPEQRQREQLLKGLKLRRDVVTARITEAEARIGELDRRFCDPELYERMPPEGVRRLEEEQRRLRAEVEELMAEWERLEAELSS